LISLSFETLSLLTAIVFYTQKRNKILLYFIPFLLLTVMVELIGWWITARKGSGKYALYNIFFTIEFIFYAFIFFLHLNNKTFKKIVLLFIPAFILAVLLNSFFIQGVNKTLAYTSLIGSFFVVLFCCLFFYESILPDQIDQHLSKQPFFWICSGLLIFYLGSVIINALFEYLISNDLQEQGKRIYSIITHSLNVILYSTFCIAFYLCPNNKKTYSSQL
jgi:hypothetical protein